MSQKLVDGKGAALTTTMVLTSNTTYQNFAVSGKGQFTSNGAALTSVKILNCTFKNITNMPIMIATWAGAAASSDIEIANCTMDTFSGQQYYWWLQNCSLLNIHDNSFTNGSGTGDCGVIFPQFSSGNFYRMYFNTYYGKCIRFWPATNSTSAIYNIIAIHSSAYSGFELQEQTGLNDGWTVSFDNCSLGDFEGSIPTAAITLYLPATPKMSYSFGASKPNIVFKTTLGKLLDNGGATSPPGAPTNSNWNTVNKYYVTMQAAGWANDAAVTLPDGTAWNAGTTPPIPVNQPPIAAIGSVAAITLPVNSVTLDGTSSADPDGTISSYAWSFVSGPNSPTLATPTAAKTLVSGMIPGIYVFGLVVTDNQGAKSPAVTTSIIVNPAIIGPAKTINLVQTVEDAAGNILSTEYFTTNL